MSLNDRQTRFIESYAACGNASEAARNAGYSPKTAGQAGHRLLANHEVKAALEVYTQQRAHEAGITVDRVRDELALIAFSNLLDYMVVQPDGTAVIDLSKITPAQAAAVASLEVEEYTEGRGDDGREVKKVKFKLWDKLSALEKLGKHLQMFTEKQDVTVRGDLADVMAAIDGRTRGLPKDSA